MTWNDVFELVQKAQAGDRDAYGVLVERFQPSVYAVALAKTRNPTEAQELAQEVFIHAMTKLAQLRDPHCFGSWLRQITVRMAINRLTRRGPLTDAEPEVLQNATAAGETPLELLVRAEQRRELLGGLARLKELDRETLEAFYMRGHSLQEMSREFETPIGTIKRRLHVARKRLRRQLERAEAGRSRRAQRREMACVN